MNSLPALETRLNAMLDTIDDARMNAAQGRVHDLTAMKNEADRVCAEILKLPPAEARSLQPLIGDLITRLDELEQTLDSFKQQVEE